MNQIKESNFLEKNFNSSQILASNPNNSSWVFASAGSGKTKILTDRVLRLLLENVAPNKILCLTFTKVAATEMYNRINSELSKWVIADDQELIVKISNLTGKQPSTIELNSARTLLAKILDEEEKIKIQTIHSFCNSLLKIFPIEAKLNPNFELLENSEENLLLKKAYKQVLNEADEDNDLRKVITEIVSETSEETINDAVSKILNKKENIIKLKQQNNNSINETIKTIYKLFNFNEILNEEELFDDFINDFDFKEYNNFINDLEQSNSKKNLEIANKLRKFIDSPLLKNFSPFLQYALHTKEDKIRKISEKLDIKYQDFIHLQSNKINSLIDKLALISIIKNTSNLIIFADKILQSYQKIKNENSLIDYNDLINYTNNLLKNPDFTDWVKKKLDSSFNHILVDESQDTNIQQWEIIKALTEDFYSGLSANNENRTIFIVGDEKQSIYSFQGSDIKVTSAVFNFFENRLQEKLNKIEMNISYRSSSKILEAVDAVFSNEQRKNSISKISAFKNHVPHRKSHGYVAIWPKIILDFKENEKEWNIDFNNKIDCEEKDKSILARSIAKNIRSWIDNKREIKDSKKEIKYSDIMVLIKNKTNGLAKEINKYFNYYNIPFTTIAKIKFNESLLIQDIISVAKFTLLPEDDLNLACLLKSCFFNITEEDLLNFCVIKNQQKQSLYRSIDNDLIKFRLDKIIKSSQKQNCFEFFYNLIENDNNYDKLLSCFGYEAIELIDSFLLNVLEFSKKHSPFIQKYIEYIEKHNPEINNSSVENNKVKITTIHSSKGLEAPIVIIPDCNHQLNKTESIKEKIFWINEIPIWTVNNFQKSKIIQQYKTEKINDDKDEYLRLLYVAMTRARDELYIGSFGKSEDENCWYKIIYESLKNIADYINIDDFVDIKILENKNFNDEKIDDSANNTYSSVNQNKYHQSEKNLVIESLLYGDQTDQIINKEQIKGEIIHKILEFFGQNHQQEKSWLILIAKKIIENSVFLNPAEKDEIFKLVNNFIYSDQFKEIFKGKIRCETEISHNEIFGRVDLISEQQDKILIIDYKSDESLPNQIPIQYQQQLDRYLTIAKNIYKNKNITVAIFWIRFLKMQVVFQS